MSKIIVQKTVLLDLEFVLAAEAHPDNKKFIQQWSKDQHMEALSSVTSEHFLLTDNNKAVGFFIMQDLDKPSFQLRRLVVTKKGNGYGRQALRWIKDWSFIKRSAQHLWLDVLPYNVVARALYKSEGFIEEATPSTCRAIQSSSNLSNPEGIQAIVMSISKTDYLAHNLQP